MQVSHHTCDASFDMECVCCLRSVQQENFGQDSNLGRDLISGVKLGEQEEPRRSPGGVSNIYLSKYSVNVT